MDMNIKEDWLRDFRKVVEHEILEVGGKKADAYRAMATKTGLGYDYIYQIYNGKPADRPKVPSADAMSIIRHVYKEVLKEKSNVSVGPDLYGEVPLLTSVQAGMYKEFIVAPDVPRIPAFAPVKEKTFALRVSGPSMEPEFSDGAIIMVEPDADILPGDYVIARNGDNETTFKKLVKDGAELYLYPLNDKFPAKPLGDAVIVGKVIGQVKRY